MVTASFGRSSIQWFAGRLSSHEEEAVVLIDGDYMWMER
jgi:hypothetical protein